MTRSLPVLAITSLLFVACSTSKPVAATPPVDPVTDPTIVGAVDEAALQGSIEGEKAAEQGRRIGSVAGIIAAVAGGPSVQTPEDVIERFRRTRDAFETTAATIGATNGAVAGAKRGIELDQQFAELHEIEGVDVIRPMPDEIVARFTTSPTPELLEKIAAVFQNREPRNVDIEAAGDVATRIGDSLSARGVTGIEAHRNDDLAIVVLRIHYRA